VRILIFTLEFPPFAGGAGTYSHDLAKGFAKIGHGVTVLTRNYKGMGEEQIKLDKNLSNIDITVLRKPWISKLWNILWNFILRQFLLKYRNEFDLLLITDCGAQIIASAMPKELLKNYAITVHGTEVRGHFQKTSWICRLSYSSQKVRGLFNQATCLIAISQSTYDLIKEFGFGSKKTKVVCPGIDTDIFYPATNIDEVDAYKKRIGVNSAFPLILTASRLVKDKGQDVLIKAFHKIVPLFPKAKLLIAGNGPDKSYLETLVKDEGLGDSIRFVGRMRRGDLCNLYQASDVFVLVSRRFEKESFGIVYIEANACKKIVVAGRVGGVPEAVEDGLSGILVDPYNSDECANTIIKILEDPEMRCEMEKKAYKRVLKRFTNIHMAQKTIEAILNNLHD